MSRRLGIEQSVSAACESLPGPLAACLVLAFYPGLGLVVPVAFGAPVAWLAAMNVCGVSIAFAIAVAWLEPRLNSVYRRHLLEWTTDLRQLSATEFEWLVGEIFRRDGWAVRETGRADAPDGNVDLELHRGDERRIIQCKRWTSRVVGVDEIRKFAGTLLRERLPGESGVFVTFSDFNSDARAEAKAIGLTLIDRPALLTRLDEVRHGPACPECRRPMRLVRSRQGWSHRCIADGCRGEQYLGNDPDHVVELLTGHN